MSAPAVETPAAVAPTTEPSVETITEGVKNTSVDSKPDNVEADAAHAVSAAEGRRLYIGNLAYSTTDEQLREFFTGFSIESTSIPTHPRTGRAVGYAFVDLTTKEEADRAIAELSGKEVVERKVSVQLARKPGSNGTKKEGEEGATEGEQPKKKSSSRARKSRRANKAGQEGEAKTGNEQPLAESTNVKTEQPDAASAGANNADKTKKKRGPPENGVPSATKIMVANLPYELSEDKLKELFAAYQPESAKIALRPIPRYMVRKLQARGEPRKGRGFGFVTLASEEMQKKAVDEMNGKVVDGREIAVKVAIDSQAQENENKENLATTETSQADTPAAEANGVEAEATAA